MTEPTIDQKRAVAKAAGIYEEIVITEPDPSSPWGKERDTGERMEIASDAPIEEWNPHRDWMDAAPLVEAFDMDICRRGEGTYRAWGYGPDWDKGRRASLCGPVCGTRAEAVWKCALAVVEGRGKQ